MRPPAWERGADALDRTNRWGCEVSRRLRPSPSMIVALVALMIALGGTSYAVVRLPAHSVGTKELKSQAVARGNIKNGAVDGSKVAGGSLTGANINLATLGKVPSAVGADHSDHATAAARLDMVFYKTATGKIPAPTTVDPTTKTPITTFATGLASCDPGQVVVGGGVKLDSSDKAAAVVDSFPSGGVGWTAHLSNDDLNIEHTFMVYAICVPAGGVG